jgi:hypothetical protein
LNPQLQLTQVQMFEALRGFLLAVVPNIEVIRSQTNRVPEPLGPDFVTMVEILRERLATNVVTPPASNTAASLTIATPWKVTVQLDVHGPASGDNAMTIAGLFRDDYAVQIFQASGYDVTPLYCGEPRQAPFLNAEQQIEQRWTFDAVMQCNLVITVPQQFAVSLDANVIDVDVAYHP